MTSFLNRLNGWQRIFLFVVLLIYTPIFLSVASNVESINVYKYSDYDINKKIEEYIKDEKIQSLVSIKIQNQITKLDYKKVPLADLPDSIKNKDLLEAEFISQENRQKYIVTFEGIKDKNNFINDPESLKLGKFIQEIIDKNKLQNKTYTKYVEIFLYFSLTTFLTYFVGFMIGWVYVGFKK